MDSILDTIKKMLGIDSAYTAFDVDIIVHINSALMTLTQLGVGIPGGFVITDNAATWETFLEGATDLSSVISYVYLKTKLVFDPPANSFVIESINKSLDEIEYRLYEQIETFRKEVRD